MGLYRVSVSCLRSSLELVMHGTYYQLCRNLHDYRSWRCSRCDISFDNACNNLNKLDTVKSINDFLYLHLFLLLTLGMEVQVQFTLDNPLEKCLHYIVIP